MWCQILIKQINKASSKRLNVVNESSNQDGEIERGKSSYHDSPEVAFFNRPISWLALEKLGSLSARVFFVVTCNWTRDVFFRQTCPNRIFSDWGPKITSGFFFILYRFLNLLTGKKNYTKKKKSNQSFGEKKNLFHRTRGITQFGLEATPIKQTE